MHSTETYAYLLVEKTSKSKCVSSVIAARGWNCVNSLRTAAGYSAAMPTWQNKETDCLHTIPAILSVADNQGVQFFTMKAKAVLKGISN